MTEAKIKNNNIVLFIEKLSPNQLANYFPSKILNKGKEYYEEGHVTDCWYEDAGETLFGRIEDSREYETSLKLINSKEIKGKCTCDVVGYCSHMAALMHFGINEPILVKVESSSEKYKEYFMNFTKNELVEIIMKHADKKFLSTLDKKLTGASNAKKIFNSTEKAIKNLLKNEYQLNDLDSFNNIFTKQLDKIQGLERHIGEPLEKLILDIIDKIDEAIEDGKLYNHHLDLTFEGPESFDVVVTNYAESLEFDAKVNFLHELENKVCDRNYEMYSNLKSIHKKVFSGDDLLLLKNLLIKDADTLSDNFIQESFFAAEYLMADEEKIISLLSVEIKNEKITLKLAHIYEQLNDIAKAKSVLKKWLSENNHSLTNVYNFYLILIGAADPKFDSIAQDALKRCDDHEILITINNLIGKSDKKFEDILKKENKWEFLKFLEKSERIPEAVKLVSKFEGEDDLDDLFSFYSKNKNDFPKEAEMYFIKFIDFNLKSTGDFYYSKIEDAVRQIKIININKANTLIDSICRDYKRRINLTALLKEI